MAQTQIDAPARPRLVAEAPDARREPDAPATAETAPAKTAPAKARSSSRRRIPLLVAAVAALGVAGWYGHDWWVDGRFLVETDDAYVGADMAVIAPRISGYVATVAVAQNASVRTGDLLLKLDPEDYRLAVEAADGRIATQQAALSRFDAQLVATDAQVAQARAQGASADAENARAAADFDRAQQLARSTFGSKQSLDQARADRDRAAAAVESAKAGLALAQANRAVLAAQKTEAERTLAELVTARAQKQRDLDATEIRAPFDGVVGNKAVQDGDYVTPAKRLMAIAPLSQVYVDANFKETQLADIRPGSTVRLAVDAYPDHDVSGVVDSLAPASGAQFSLLPPENATGNFTKIVQRVPVRIRIDPKDVASGALRPGLSVVASVDTRTAPKNARDAQKDTPDAASERR